MGGKEEKLVPYDRCKAGERKVIMNLHGKNGLLQLELWEKSGS